MKQTRRSLIKNIALGTSAAIAAPAISFAKKFDTEKDDMLKGNINHSVCQWTYSSFSLDELCEAVKKIGFNAIDLIGPKDWPVLQKHGVYCSMCYTSGSNSLTKGLNNPLYHDQLIKEYQEVIPLMKKAGYKNLICFSGSRNGMDDETGIKNCAEALKKILPLAEKNGVTLIMELLNSKVDHKDYMCDHTAWGVKLCKHIGSENFKLLYDIYHMQIDEGDVIRTIRDNHQYIAHYHTGGVPGRHEIDETQELFYPAIMKAILETGFKGFVAQEFMPARKDKLDSLKKAIKICDV
ncbi:MAG TPA: sugar phosphate isomerase/epimerase family protein [Hanamia sp.]|nr:sugar phosphate isomerase/epimerase family protein [Hanamia sp.]